MVFPRVPPFSPPGPPSIVSAGSDDFDVESPLKDQRKTLTRTEAFWFSSERQDTDVQRACAGRRRSRASLMGLDLRCRDDEDLDLRDDTSISEREEHDDDLYETPRSEGRRSSQSSFSTLTTKLAAAAPVAAAAAVAKRRSSTFSTPPTVFKGSASSLFDNKYLATLVVLSWLACWVTNFGVVQDSDLSALVPTPSSPSLDTLQHLMRLDEHRDMHLKHYRQELNAVTEQNRNAQDTLQFHKARHTHLDHEVRVFEELSTQGVHMNPLNKNPAHNTIEMVKDWLYHRQQGLERRVKTLQARLQETDRMALIDLYGPGPTYRVQVNVEINDEQRKVKSFVVELASNEHMPHTVLYFLNWVSAKAWDNTAFLHHEKVSHVLAAMPIDYTTKEERPKDQLMAFPEYSSYYPHEKYTLGMGKLGPSFYINTYSNAIWHGPGGHKRSTVFSEEGDPCFGKIVEGKEVVDQLISYGESLNKAQKKPKNKDRPENWTRIVSMKLLK